MAAKRGSVVGENVCQGALRPAESRRIVLSGYAVTTELGSDMVDLRPAGTCEVYAVNAPREVI